MKGYVEKMIKEYPRMVREREALRKQIEEIEFLSAEELISAMSFSHPDGERVQSSDLSDKTAKIAMSYQRRLDYINDEMIEPMIKKLGAMDEEIEFFENAVRRLPREVAAIGAALFLEGLSWDEMESEFYMGRKYIAKYRDQAIDCLVRQYQIRESQMEAQLLS